MSVLPPGDGASGLRPLNALAFTRGARTKPSVTDSEREGRLAQAGAVGVQCLVGQLRAAIETIFIRLTRSSRCQREAVERSDSASLRRRES
jgi:hypothetical protein